MHYTIICVFYHFDFCSLIVICTVKSITFVILTLFRLFDVVLCFIYVLKPTNFYDRIKIKEVVRRKKWREKKNEKMKEGIKETDLRF